MTEAILTDKFDSDAIRLDLIEKGIVVVPGLISPEMIARLLQDAEKIEPSRWNVDDWGNRFYRFLFPSQSTENMQEVGGGLQELLIGNLSSDLKHEDGYRKVVPLEFNDYAFIDYPSGNSLPTHFDGPQCWLIHASVTVKGDSYSWGYTKAHYLKPKRGSLAVGEPHTKTTVHSEPGDVVLTQEGGFAGMDKRIAHGVKAGKNGRLGLIYRYQNP